MRSIGLDPASTSFQSLLLSRYSLGPTGTFTAASGAWVLLLAVTVISSRAFWFREDSSAAGAAVSLSDADVLPLAATAGVPPEMSGGLCAMAGAANTADNASSAKMILIGPVRGLNRRSVKNAAMTLSSWLSSGAKARREVATNGQRISASQPSVTFPRAMIQTLDVRPLINTERRPASRVGVLGCGSIGSTESPK